MAREHRHVRLVRDEPDEGVDHSAMERAVPLMVQLAKIADRMRELEEERRALRQARDRIVDALAAIARTEWVVWIGSASFLACAACSFGADAPTPF